VWRRTATAVVDEQMFACVPPEERMPTGAGVAAPCFAHLL
jgi:hypothetical protein